MTRTHARACGLLVAVSAAWGHFMLGHMGGGFAHDAGDPLLNTWILWWNARTLPFSPHWWNAPAFYPATGAASFTENLVGLGLIATPVYWISGNAVLAHNVALLVSYPLAGIAAYWLAFELTHSVPASLVGAAAFAFAPYRVVQLPHIQVLTSYWMPCALLALHKYLAGEDRRWLVLFGGAWILNALSNGYFMFYFGVLLGLWLLWFVVMPRRWPALAAILSAWAIASVPLAFVFWNYLGIHRYYGLHWNRDSLWRYGGDLAAALTTSPHLLLWGRLQVYPRAEGELFPGVTVMFLLAAGIAASLLWPERDSTRTRRRSWAAARIVAKVAVVAAAVAIVLRLWLGSFRVKLWLFTLAVGRVERPAAVLVLLGILLLVTSERVRGLARSPSPFLFYTGALAVTWLLSLGPRPTFFGREFLEEGPYGWLLLLPGFDSLRVPARFWMIAILCLSIAVSLAFAILTRRMRTATPFALLAAGAIVAEAWVSGMPVEAAPAADRCAAPAERASALLVLPLGGIGGDLRAMYQGMVWGVPVVNGYSGHTPPHYQSLRYGLAEHDHGMLAELASGGNLYVLVNDAEDSDGHWRAFAAEHPGSTPLSTCPGRHLYRIRGTPPVRDVTATGTPARIASLTSDISTDTLPNVVDGNLESRWEVGQVQSHWLQADLGTRQPIAGVVMSLGSFWLDFPRKLSIAVSDDGLAWREVRSGPTHRETFRAALSKPAELPLQFPLDVVTARYVRLTQNGFEERLSWSIAELRILLVR